MSGKERKEKGKQVNRKKGKVVSENKENVGKYVKRAGQE